MISKQIKFFGRATYGDVFVGLFHMASWGCVCIQEWGNYRSCFGGISRYFSSSLFTDIFFLVLKVEAPAAKKMKTAASNGASGHPKQPNIMNFFKKK